MREIGLIKIGKAMVPEIRRTVLQIGVPFDLLLIGALKEPYWTEARVHRKFAKLRVRGEWFRGAPELLEFIKDRCQLYYPEAPLVDSDGVPIPAPPRPVELVMPPDPASIDALPLTDRVRSALHRSGIHKIEELQRGLATGKIGLIRLIGPKSLEQLKGAIEGSGEVSG